jgi:hypothetical protein
MVQYIYQRNSKQLYQKGGDVMTGKEIVNLIRKLKEKGLTSDEILAIIEYIETHNPEEQE